MEILKKFILQLWVCGVFQVTMYKKALSNQNNKFIKKLYATFWLKLIYKLNILGQSIWVQT